MFLISLYYLVIEPMVFCRLQGQSLLKANCQLLMVRFLLVSSSARFFLFKSSPKYNTIF